ncbi:Tim8 [Drosophila busckii]|uniref:Tim8 n=1 Tax=Drosophila busckii TaxID=30019 RepID=A0A0M4EZ86_DROBS|nr:Tim8 [Drosophila busckii]
MRPSLTIFWLELPLCSEAVAKLALSAVEACPPLLLSSIAGAALPKQKHTHSQSHTHTHTERDKKTSFFLSSNSLFAYLWLYCFLRVAATFVSTLFLFFLCTHLQMYQNYSKRYMRCQH